MRALVIDDSRAIRMILARILSDAGLVVLEAGTAEEALALVERQGPFDLAIVDWDLPALDGFELSALLREAEFGPRCIVMTLPRDRDDLVHAATEAGADEHLTKPCMRAGVETLLDRFGFKRRTA